MLTCDKCKDVNRIAKEYKLQIINQLTQETVNERSIHLCDNCRGTLLIEIIPDKEDTIFSIDWGTGIRKRLLANNITSIQKLLSLSKTELYQIRNLGMVRINTINQKLIEAGYPPLKDD